MSSLEPFTGSRRIAPDAPADSIAARGYLSALEAEATHLESRHNSGPGFWKGLANKAAIARLETRRLQRDLAALERRMGAIR